VELNHQNFLSLVFLTPTTPTILLRVRSILCFLFALNLINDCLERTTKDEDPQSFDQQYDTQASNSIGETERREIRISSCQVKSSEVRPYKNNKEGERFCCSNNNNNNLIK
jgi:hypothetical protein